MLFAGKSDTELRSMKIRSAQAPSFITPSSPSRPRAFAAFTVGILSTLVMGTGMSCCLEGGPNLFWPGILIGVAGLLGMAAAYPLYLHIVRIRREKLTPEILQLTEELLK